MDVFFYKLTLTGSAYEQHTNPEELNVPCNKIIVIWADKVNCLIARISGEKNDTDIYRRNSEIWVHHGDVGWHMWSFSIRTLLNSGFIETRGKTGLFDKTESESLAQNPFMVLLVLHTKARTDGKELR